MKVILLMSVLALSSGAQGALLATGDILFRFTGTASGRVGSEPFSNLPFEIRVAADTASAGRVDSFVRQILAEAAVVDLDGFGSGAIQVDLRLYQGPFVSTPPGAPPGSETVGLGLASGPDLLNLFHPLFAGYELVSELGPVFVETPDFQSRLAFNDVPTGLGALTFTESRSVTFSATRIPEPSHVSLLALVFLAVAVVGRRRGARLPTGGTRGDPTVSSGL